MRSTKCTCMHGAYGPNQHGQLTRGTHVPAGLHRTHAMCKCRGLLCRSAPARSFGHGHRSRHRPFTVPSGAISEMPDPIDQSSARQANAVETASVSSARKPEVCVIGAGVIGLSVAVRLRQELPDIAVTVIADRFVNDTTSIGAAGLWEPYKLDETPADRVNAWGAQTYDYLQDLYHSTHAAAAGITTVSAYQLWSEPHEDPSWRDVVPHFRHLGPRELAPFEAAGACKYAQGWCFTTIICEQSLYIPWLMDRALRAGVSLQFRTIQDLQELHGFSAVANCTGLGAARLFGDTEMYPVRGHVIRVRAPWIKSNYFVNEDNYVIPNLDTVVLGGTAQRGDTDTTPRQEDRDHIWRGCLKLMPSLAQAKPEREWVGLRPGRRSVRLEYEDVDLSEHGGQGTLKVVHNYGHGGGGVTLAWGCALEAVQLIRQALSA